MAEQPPDEDQVQLPLVWVGIDDQPMLFINQFIGQFLEDEFILTFGEVAPPPVLGTREQKLEQVKQIEFVQVRAVARFALTRSRLEELAKLLEETLSNYDKHQEKPS